MLKKVLYVTVLGIVMMGTLPVMAQSKKSLALAERTNQLTKRRETLAQRLENMNKSSAPQQAKDSLQKQLANIDQQLARMNEHEAKGNTGATKGDNSSQKEMMEFMKQQNTLRGAISKSEAKDKKKLFETLKSNQDALKQLMQDRSTPASQKADRLKELKQQFEELKKSVESPAGK